VGRADLQLHSDLGDGLASPEAILDAAERVGLDVIALTDHDDIRGAFLLRDIAARRSSPIEIVPGVEVTTRNGHLLALWVEDEIPMFAPLAATVSLNQKVLHVAETGSSDAHHAKLVGTTWTDFAGDDAAGLRRAITDRTTRPDGRHWTLAEHLDGVATQQWRSMVRDPVKRARRRIRKEK
jgi:hypothetical protein